MKKPLETVQMVSERFNPWLKKPFETAHKIREVQFRLLKIKDVRKFQKLENSDRYEVYN